MALTASSSVPANMPPPVAVHGLHHFAWRCRDAEETRHFYEDILGLPLVHVIRAENVPSTGEYCPYVHIFFRLQDGSSMAFFDLGDDTAAEPSSNTPAWVNHIALRVASLHELEQARQRLLQHGVDVIGIACNPVQPLGLLGRGGVGELAHRFHIAAGAAGDFHITQGNL